MAKIVTIYGPDGEPHKATRANAVDLVRHSNFSWQPGMKSQPHHPAATDLSERDNFPDLSKNSETGHTKLSYREQLEEDAVNLGVEFRSNISDEKLAERVKDRREELAKDANTIDGNTGNSEDDEDEDETEE